jgi:hypothetical protein
LRGDLWSFSLAVYLAVSSFFKAYHKGVLKGFAKFSPHGAIIVANWSVVRLHKSKGSNKKWSGWTILNSAAEFWRF